MKCFQCCALSLKCIAEHMVSFTPKQTSSAADTLSQIADSLNKFGKARKDTDVETVLCSQSSAGAEEERRQPVAPATAASGAGDESQNAGRFKRSRAAIWTEGDDA